MDKLSDKELERRAKKRAKNKKNTAKERSKKKPVLGVQQGDRAMMSKVLTTLESKVTEFQGGNVSKTQMRKGFVENLFDVAELNKLFSDYETYMSRMKIPYDVINDAEGQAWYRFRVQKMNGTVKNFRQTMMCDSYFSTWVTRNQKGKTPIVKLYVDLWQLLQGKKKGPKAFLTQFKRIMRLVTKSSKDQSYDYALYDSLDYGDGAGFDELVTQYVKIEEDKDAMKEIKNVIKTTKKESTKINKKKKKDKNLKKRGEKAPLLGDNDDF